jgi:hypothetical protein
VCVRERKDIYQTCKYATTSTTTRCLNFPLACTTECYHTYTSDAHIMYKILYVHTIHTYNTPHDKGTYLMTLLVYPARKNQIRIYKNVNKSLFDIAVHSIVHSNRNNIFINMLIRNLNIHTSTHNKL